MDEGSSTCVLTEPDLVFDTTNVILCPFEQIPHESQAMSTLCLTVASFPKKNVAATLFFGNVATVAPNCTFRTTSQEYHNAVSILSVIARLLDPS